MLMGCIPRCFNNSLMCEFVKHGQCGYSGRKYEISLIESLQVTYDCMTRRQELLVYWGLFPESVQHSAQSVKFPKQSDCYIVCVGLLCIECFVEPFLAWCWDTETMQGWNSGVRHLPTLRHLNRAARLLRRVRSLSKRQQNMNDTVSRYISVIIQNSQDVGAKRNNANAGKFEC